MIIKILETDLTQFLTDNGINIEEHASIVFLMLDSNPSDYVYIDMLDNIFDETDTRIEIQPDIETVEKAVAEEAAISASTKLDRSMFINNGTVEISSGKVFYMDSQSRIDILTTVLLSVTNPELVTPTIPWKTPNGVEDVTIAELGEALLVSMQIRKSLVGL